jgi:hypothetical protein
VARRLFLILLALVLALSVGLVACSGGSEQEEEEEEEEEEPWVSDYGEVSFSQLAWMASTDKALYPYSNIGEVEFSFSEGAGDWLLEDYGNEDYGGGWLNVVIDTTDAGGDVEWAVQNLYLVYPDMDYLLGSTPSVQFSLGLDNETRIEEGQLQAAVFLSHEPLEGQPQADELLTYPVSSMPYLVGGLDGEASADPTIPHLNGSFVGADFIGCSSPAVSTESICFPVNQVASIDEDVNMCSCGAYARSIYYLAMKWLFPADNPQMIYDDLVEARETVWATNQTWPQKVLCLKDSYCGQNCTNIASELVLKTGSGGNISWSDLTKKVQGALKDCCDVEIWYGWRKNVAGNFTGHMAMVTSVTNHRDGSTTIHCVDDPQQGMGGAQNHEHVVSTNNSGWAPNGLHVVYGFVIECFTT